MCAKSGSGKQRIIQLLGVPNAEEKEPWKGFDLMENVAWAEGDQAITHMDELGSVVFAAGEEDELGKVT